MLYGLIRKVTKEGYKPSASRIRARVSYISITSTKSTFCTTRCSASLTNLTPLLPQSRDCSCYISRPILAPPPPPLWLQKHIDIRAHDFAHSPHFWYQARLANGTCAWSWRLYGNNLVIHPSRHRHRQWFWLSSVGLQSNELHLTETFNPRFTNMGLVPPWEQSGPKTGAARIWQLCRDVTPCACRHAQKQRQLRSTASARLVTFQQSHDSRYSQ
jgi:hypothetical protein